MPHPAADQKIRNNLPCLLVDDTRWSGGRSAMSALPSGVDPVEPWNSVHGEAMNGAGRRILSSAAVPGMVIAAAGLLGNWQHHGG